MTRELRNGLCRDRYVEDVGVPMGAAGDVEVMGTVRKRVAEMNASVTATSSVVPGAIVRRGGVSFSTLGEPPPVRAIPAAGDIVMDLYGDDQARAYIQGSATGVDQYRLRTREEALAFVLNYARRQHVRAWLTDNWFDFVIIDEVSAPGAVR